ncbi:MAG: hypothetical protein AAGK14_02135 [Verrucomicrobiota bacterium]
MIHPVLGILAVFVGLLLLIGFLRLAQKQWNLHPEFVRKCAHVLMGLVTLSFPWLFDEFWPVLVTGALALVALISLRTVTTLKSRLGSVLGGVERESWGEFYFPIAVVLVYWLAEGDPLLYVVPILILTLADAVGALVGTRYGLSKYETDEGRKSYEGSLAFFLVAFFAVHIPLLLLTPTGRAESLLTALTLAFLVTMMEALAWRGLDNLFIPITAFFALDLYRHLTAGALLERFIVLIILATIALIWRKHTTLTDSSALGGAVFGYITWTLGGWTWLVAPLILFLLYTKIGKEQGNKLSSRDMQAVIRVMSGPMIILFVAISIPWAALIAVFYAAFGAHLANVSVSREHTVHWEKTPLKFLAKSILISWLLFAAPYLAIMGLTYANTAIALLMLLPVAISAVIFYRTIRYSKIGADWKIVWFREGALAPVSAAVCVPPLLSMGGWT